jgi:hypothetical protein
MSIVLMVLAPFVLGGTAFWYIARFGRKAAEGASRDGR